VLLDTATQVPFEHLALRVPPPNLVVEKLGSESRVKAVGFKEVIVREQGAWLMVGDVGDVGRREVAGGKWR